jgi:hypothetical protein
MYALQQAVRSETAYRPHVLLVEDELTIARGLKMVPYKMLDLMKEPKVRPDEPYRILRSLEYDAVEIDPRELFL